MSGAALVAWCPAKVNLTLRVLGRRADGYHELETWFQAIDLWDRLEAVPGERLELACDDPRVPDGPSNLVLRAAEAIRALVQAPKPGASFRLFKKIPVQGGLGGGSSDAAATLLLCSKLWDLDLGPERLHSLAAGLGADVPFFLTGGTARGTGRGDRIDPVPFLGEFPLLLGVPPFGISTEEVFGAFAKRLTPPGNDVSVPVLTGLNYREHNDFSFMRNDLEQVVFPAWPALRAFRDTLREAGALGALLSGSGSTVYGVFPERFVLAPIAERIAKRFADWSIVTTRAVPGGAYVAAKGGAR